MKPYQSQLVPSAQVCKRYGINRRTFGRWMVDPALNFPKPTTINGRHYFSADDLSAWELSCAKRQAGGQQANA